MDGLSETPVTDYKFKADLVNDRDGFLKTMTDIFADDKDPERVKPWLKEWLSDKKIPASDETVHAYVD